MNPDHVRTCLVKVLKDIQALSGEECPPITGATKPATDLPRFNSKMWPVGTGMLASELDVTIPAEVCIFRRKGTTDALSIDEIVPIVCRILDADRGSEGRSGVRANEHTRA